MFIPGKSYNVQKGDIILSSDPGSPVGKMLKALGHYWDHAMMITGDDALTMTHNTLDVSKLKDIIEYKKDTIFLTIFAVKTDIPKRLNPKKLSNSSPGIITEEVKGRGNYRAVLTISDEENRIHVNEMADYMKGLSGYYILNAFVDVKKYEPLFNSKLELNKGSHCSGTIWWASKHTEREMSLFTLDNSDGLISACANTMKTCVRDYIRKILKDSQRGKYTKEIRNDIYEQLIGSKYDCDDKIAHQVVNTFLFNRSDRTDDYWKKHINEVVIESIAPDHLLMQGMPNMNGNLGKKGGMPGRQEPATSYYDTITLYTENGGYYFYDSTNGGPRYAPIYDTPCEMGIGVRCCK